MNAEMNVPRWVKYMVVTYAGQAAACSTLERACETLTKNRLHFLAQVIRVEDDTTIWPWEVKGGEA